MKIRVIPLLLMLTACTAKDKPPPQPLSASEQACLERVSEAVLRDANKRQEEVIAAVNSGHVDEYLAKEKLRETQHVQQMCTELAQCYEVADETERYMLIGSCMDFISADG